MPRKYELTWQPGSKGHNGRWRKKYKGQVLYFSYGSSRSDLEGYRKAVDEWKRRKDEIDAEEAAKPKPHQQDYKRAFDECSEILRWSLEHDDKKSAEAARQKLEILGARLASKNPPPLDTGISLVSACESITSVNREVVQAFNEQMLGASPTADLDGLGTAAERFHDTIYDSDASPSRIEREIWRDRLEIQRRKGRNAANTTASCVESFLSKKRALVESHELSAGRYNVLQIHLRHFQNWIGPSSPVSSISGKSIADYHTELLNGVAKEKLSVDYAQNWMSVVKLFMRWLWHIEAIEQLPRILYSRELRIGTKVTKPEVFTDNEIRTCLASATDRTKLYLLLMLNCGMTQKDISDLSRKDVDWTKGRITRKRSKTAKHENVPTVSYILWKETFRLLQQEGSTSSDLVLSSKDCGPLKEERLDEYGRLRKIDNVRNDFKRLKRVTKIEKSLKLFRKTSATLLRGSQEFSGLEVLFLGHAPQTMSDRHYAQVPQDRLDNAILWLGKQYGIE